MGRNKQPARRTGTREPKYGRYLIFTNGEKTEVNYFNGLRKSLPIEVQDNIQISIYTCKLDNFENEIQRVKSKYQYSKTYIGFCHYKYIFPFIFLYNISNSCWCKLGI